MADVETAPELPTEIIPASGTEPLSLRDAANAATDYRNKRDAKAREPEQPEAPEQAAAPVEESPPQEENGNQETAPAEQTETTEQAEVPPIEPPRSWTKEEKAEFATYPREAQEKIARREQDREQALRRGQNETAEQRKAIEAERAKLNNLIQEYETAIPAELQALQQITAGEFSDIKTQADITKLAAEDWPRFSRYQAHMMNIGQKQQQLAAAQQRQTQEFENQWAEFASKEDAKFIEAAPEMADKDKASKIADASVAMLKNVGFTEQDLAKLWQGKASVSLRDSRVQLLIRDAVRYREAQKAVKATVKIVQQVQRPGVANARGADADLRIKNLDTQLERSGNWKDAADLLIAQRSKRK